MANGSERQLKLDSAVEECRYLMERVLKQGECWVFAIDPENYFTIEFDASATPPCIMAKASLRESVSNPKAKEVRALGWNVSSSKFIKTAAVTAALYLTSGLAAAALLSRGVRDMLMSIEGTRSWIVKGPKDLLTGPAAELARALQRVAPDVETIVVKRREADPQA
jgi:hypothetical protein